MSNQRAHTLAEILVAAALFSVFLVVSSSLFVGVLRIAEREQKPASRKVEARTAALRIAASLRNCEQLLDPPLSELLKTPSDHVLLRDASRQITLGYRLDRGLLQEIVYRPDYDPANAETHKPERIKPLGKLEALQVSSGGYYYPTRIEVRLTPLQLEPVRAVTNFREAI
ncbi:MAG: type II secretion system protein J [Vulcanimicrobiota bacterium]